jgi:3-deoxy-D-manno-octulosonate 8-phosphate phosphatase (KDO 8-P phosphatase)
LDWSGLAEQFAGAGGRFVTPIEELAARLEGCRAIVFDWDGVFNDGRKRESTGSGFTEADSMGTNMLRYGFWRRSGTLPYAAIISGEDNESARTFAAREHFDAAYTGMRDKQQVIDHVCGERDLEPAQIACVFDDINDLPMAAVCGLRFRVGRTASPLFSSLADAQGYSDYVSGAAGGAFAVREICELMLGLMGCYGEVIQSRKNFDARYQAYFALRQKVPPVFFGQDGKAIRGRDIT